MIDIHQRNTAMHFLSETIFFYILLTIIPYAADRRALGTKGMFFCKYLCFLFGHCVKSTRTDPSYSPIYFLLMPPEASSCFGMILDEGVERAPLSCLSLAARRAWLDSEWQRDGNDSDGRCDGDTMTMQRRWKV
jgi:hypothetical protein